MNERENKGIDPRSALKQVYISRESKVLAFSINIARMRKGLSLGQMQVEALTTGEPKKLAEELTTEAYLEFDAMMESFEGVVLEKFPDNERDQIRLEMLNVAKEWWEEKIEEPDRSVEQVMLGRKRLTYLNGKIERILNPEAEGE